MAAFASNAAVGGNAGHCQCMAAIHTDVACPITASWYHAMLHCTKDSMAPVLQVSLKTKLFLKHCEKLPALWSSFIATVSNLQDTPMAFCSNLQHQYSCIHTLPFFDLPCIITAACYHNFFGPLMLKRQNALWCNAVTSSPPGVLGL